MEYILQYNNWKKLVESVESQNSILAANNLTQETFASASSIDTEALLDLTIDLISGLIEAIPGIGTIVSASVDILHTLSYALRWFLVEGDESKIKYGVLTILGLGTQFIPFAGNAANISAQLGISEILKVSVNKIAPYVGGLKTPLGRWASLNKQSFNFLYVLLRILGEQASEVLLKIINFFNSTANSIILELKKYLSGQFGWIIKMIIDAFSNMSKLFNDFKKYYNEVNTIIKTANQQ